MARTPEQVYDEMLTAKAAQSALDAINSTSLAGYTMNLLYLVATAISTFETVMDELKAEVLSAFTTDKENTGHLSWWQKKSFEFQYGYEVTVTAEKSGFDVYDEVAQIIKAASCIEDHTVPGGVLLKVAKLDGAGEFTTLTTAELDAFKAYNKKIKPAGPEPTAVSLNGDIFRLEAEVFYNPLVMNPDGSLIDDPTVFPVEEAIDAYRKSLEYDGVIDLHRLQDNVQAEKDRGVNNFVLGDASIDTGSGFNAIGRRYTTISGYAVLASTPADELSATLTYTAGQ
jgi:hypothetical protein